MSKVAIITGGASGMGFAVATALAKRGNWKLHLLDMNEARGNEAASSLKASFHKTNVTNYQEFAAVFDKIFKAKNRLDFVFANAGIVERWDFYGKNEQSPPPAPDTLVVDINYTSVIYTAYLAQHYFRLSKDNYGTGEQNIVMTASCGGFYPSPFSPMYAGTKSGVTNFMRSIAKAYYFNDRIRVNTINPGTVRTNLLDSEAWNHFPDSYFTPVEKIVEVVLMLIDGGAMEDSKGNKVEAGKDWMRAVEVNGKNHYFRDQPEYCDEAMAAVMRATDVSEVGNGKFFDPK